MKYTLGCVFFLMMITQARCQEAAGGNKSPVKLKPQGSNPMSVLDRINALPQPEGGTVVLSGEEFSTPLLIKGKKNINIVGGKWTVPEGTKQGAGPASFFRVDAWVLITECENVSFIANEIDGNRQPIVPLCVTKSKICTISENKVLRSGWAACIVGTGNYGNRYTGNEAGESEPECRGLWIGNWNKGEEEIAPFVAYNQVHDTGHTAIGTIPLGAVVLRNSIDRTTPKGTGIVVAQGSLGAPNSTELVALNSIRNVAWSGVQSDNHSVNTGTTTGATHADGKPFCIENVTVWRNQIDAAGMSGVYAVQASRWQIAENQISNCKEAGIVYSNHESLPPGTFYDWSNILTNNKLPRYMTPEAKVVYDRH